MTTRQILTYGDVRLRNKPKAVTNFDDIKGLVKDLIDTVYWVGGAGLAASQIAIDRNVVVFLSKPEKGDIIVACNLEIEDLHGIQHPEEGCLSVPEYSFPRPRAQWVKAKWQNERGVWEETEAEDFFAQVIQHEYDHHQGRIYVDPDKRIWSGSGLLDW